MNRRLYSSTFPLNMRPRGLADSHLCTVPSASADVCCSLLSIYSKMPTELMTAEPARANRNRIGDAERKRTGQDLEGDDAVGPHICGRRKVYRRYLRVFSLLRAVRSGILCVLLGLLDVWLLRALDGVLEAA